MKCKLFLLLLFFSLNSYAQHEIAPEDGVQFINKKFEQYPIVALGESHALQEQYDFLTRLLNDKQFQNTVDDIVIEFGNSLYQSTLDAYVNGDKVEQVELDEVWMNTTQSPVDPWSSVLYRKFIEQVREVNAKQGKTIRLIAGDSPINWPLVQTRKEYLQNLSRDSVMAAITCNEVLAKNRRALVITGGAHLSKIHRPSPVSRALPVNLEIEKRYPGSVYLIQTITGFGKYTEEYEPKLAGVPVGSIFNIKDTWVGKIPLPTAIGPVQSPGSNGAGASAVPSPVPAPANSLVREDVYDAFLYVGPLKDLHFVPALPVVYKDDLFWKELNRRSRIRFNNELIPASREEGSPRPVAYQ